MADNRVLAAAGAALVLFGGVVVYSAAHHHAPTATPPGPITTVAPNPAPGSTGTPSDPTSLSEAPSPGSVGSQSSAPTPSSPIQAIPTVSAAGVSIPAYPYGTTVPAVGNVALGQLSQPITDASKVADSAIIAYTSISGLDTTPSEWVGRMQPFTTPAFQHRLQSTYGNAGSSVDFAQMQAQHVQTHTTIAYTNPSDWAKRSDGTDLTFIVGYQGARKTGDGDWVQGQGYLEKQVHLVMDASGAWKVDDVTVPREG